MPHPQGVASFMEYKCVEAVFPEMNAAALFQLSVTPMGALCSVLPLQQFPWPSLGCSPGRIYCHACWHEPMMARIALGRQPVW